jgi:hypothetical protein
MANKHTASPNAQGTSDEEVIVEEVRAQEVKSDSFEEIIDPIIESPTVQRDYTQPKGEYFQDIGEPKIESPDLSDDQVDEDQQVINDDEGFSGSSKSQSKNNTIDSEDEDDDGFELNGETVVYIIDFLFKLFKEQYKISDALLEKYGLSPEIFVVKIRVQDVTMTVGDLADQYNAMMDEVNISTADKKMIKKLITTLSKKHNVKLPPEIQIFVVFGKVVLETHLNLAQTQKAFIEKISTLQPVYAGVSPDVANVADLIAGKKPADDGITETEDVNPGQKTRYKHRGQYMTKKRKAEMEARNAEMKAEGKLNNYVEPGEIRK